MRLITVDSNGSLVLLEYSDAAVPEYAILSHTWGPDREEVTFKDIINGTGTDKIGYKKIEFCHTQAAKDGLHHFWIDSCCIDKSSSAELSEAINSMFRWYQNASKCYVYLSDVTASDCLPSERDEALRNSRWFTRGWTLQELLAPKVVEFYSQESSYLGSKASLEEQVQDITQISLDALRGAPLSDFAVDERFSWARDRETKRPEDKAYSLCGIFGIRMSLFYGEGREEALARLRRKVEKSLSATPVEPLQAVVPMQRKTIDSGQARTVMHEPRCDRWCSCQCHRVRNFKSPQILSSTFGGLFLRVGAERSGCSESSCKQRRSSITFAIYRPPRWLSDTAIHLSLAASALSLQANLRALRIIPDSAEIFGAISAGDVFGIQQMFEEGRASIHDMDTHNWTLLHRAFLLGKSEVCKFLLEQGADAYVEADNGSSVVERAWLNAQRNAKSLTESVIYDNNVLPYVDIDEFVQSQQYTPVHKIILGHSKLPLLQYLETSTLGVDAPDALGYTPLFWASMKGNEYAVRTLLNYGANPNAPGRISQTPLHIARTIQVVRCLLEYGADVNARDTSGRTPLHSYSYRQIDSNPHVIEEIITAGASINSKTLAGHTALHYAAAFGNTQLIPVLFERGISINETKFDGDTSLALAVRHNQINAIKSLLDKAADVSVKNERQQSILHIAACFARVPTIELLVSYNLKGLEPCAKDKEGLSASDCFARRQDWSPDLEAAFAELIRRCQDINHPEDHFKNNEQNDETAKMDKSRPMPGTF